MRPERLAQLRDHLGGAVAFDCETYLIQPGNLAPRLVCASVAEPNLGKPPMGALISQDDAHDAFVSILKGSKVIVGANIPFDMLVMAVHAARRGVDIMPLVFGAYLDDRVFDVQIAEQLHAVAGGHLGKDPRTGRPLTDPATGKPGRYSLSTVVDLVLGRTDAKANDEWRLKYHELDSVPISEWPTAAKIYPVDDAVNTLEAAMVQAKGHRNLHNHAAQVFKHWALHLGSAWGLRTDKAATIALEAAALCGRQAGIPEFTRLGFIREDGSENQAKVRVAVALAYGADPFGECPLCGRTGRVLSETSKTKGATKTCPKCNGTALDLARCPVPMTEPTERAPHGQVKIGRDVLTESGDDTLMEYAIYQEDDKVLDTYIPFLKEGWDRPINLRPNPILETGRVSYSGHAQVLPRFVSARLALGLKGTGVVGVRDCVIPRPGWVFYSNDYSGGELVTFAEACHMRVGFSQMGEALNAGIDVHSGLGATLMGVSYDTFVRMLKVDKSVRAKSFRQAAKPANFGFPGGMGAPKMVLQQRAQGPDTEWPDGPSDLGGGRRGYKGLRFCLLIGGKEVCGLEKVTEWKERSIPPTCRACIECADLIRQAWFKQWPEARSYLNWHAQNVDTKGEVEQIYSRRIRGRTDFCSEANGDFQGLLADITGAAQCRVSHEQYVDCGTALFGSRSIVFAHDELFGEAREEVAPEVSERVNEIMVEEFRKGCPNHAKACKAEPTLMRRWYKAAECVRDEAGRLQVWEPKE